MTIEKLVKKYGKINYGGEEYVLTQDACIGGPVGEPYYTANAIIPDNGPDDDGMYPVYVLTWYPLQAWLEGDRSDDGDACDWDSPDDIDAIVGMGYDLETGRII